VQHLNTLHARGGFPFRFEVVGLAAGRNADALFAQAMTHGVKRVALCEPAKGGAPISPPSGVTLMQGADAAERMVRETACDMVVGAIVGSAGLPAMLTAAEMGIDIALANKETLVAAGSLVVAACARSGVRLLPVDSEHSGVWQCLAGASAVPPTCGSGQVGADARGSTDFAEPKSVARLAAPPFVVGPDVSRVVLTASGGALRRMSREQMESATPEQALAHPTWSMGAKVTIDSASLTNKALEVIEAHWLFGLEAERIGVLIHPQSVVHALVEFADGSSIAQLGAPDMRTPIQIAIAHPDRVPGRVGHASLSRAGRLDFEEPDLERFPALSGGFRVVREGGTSGAIFNAANEAAVEAFLARKIPFGRIARLSAAAMDEIGSSSVRDLADALKADQEARRFVLGLIS
jgi:1-deoxy-D-xylulose-5-phosphate reductoisomerase